MYIPAIAGHVPDAVTKVLVLFQDFCYLVRRAVIDRPALLKIQETVKEFHKARLVFKNVRPEGFSLPRQHSMNHYVQQVIRFGAPNGLDSSITESMHIRAVKETWRRSNRRDPLDQMLKSNIRNEKIDTGRTVFTDWGLLPGKAKSTSDQVAEIEMEPDFGNAIMIDDPDPARDVEVVEGDVSVDGIVTVGTKAGKPLPVNQCLTHE